MANGQGQAVNRGELFAERDPGVATWGPWHLELCWFVVVAAALAQLGRLEIGFKGGQLDAPGLDRLLRMDLEEIESVTHVAPPKELPIRVLKKAVTLVGIPAGHVDPGGATEALVKSVATNCAEHADRIAKARGLLSDGINVWGADVLEHRSERSASLRALEDAVNNLKARNTVGKLNRLDLTEEQILQANAGREALKWLEGAVAVATHVSDVTAYLREAVDVFGPEHPASVDASALRADLLELFRADVPPDAGRAGAIKATGEQMRQRFATEAVAAHGRDRLDGAGDERKRRILEGDIYKNLKQLTPIELLPGGRHAALEQRLVGLGTCKTFDPAALARSVTCPECGYRPRPADDATAKARLEQIEEEILGLHAEWEQALLDSLAVSEMADQIALLGAAERETVEAFLEAQRLPESVTEEFVRAVRQVLNRFEVRAISPKGVWDTLFPQAAPATIAELRERFGSLLDGLVGGSPEEKVRFVPREEDVS